MLLTIAVLGSALTWYTSIPLIIVAENGVQCTGTVTQVLRESRQGVPTRVVVSYDQPCPLTESEVEITNVPRSSDAAYGVGYRSDFIVHARDDWQSRVIPAATHPYELYGAPVVFGSLLVVAVVFVVRRARRQ